MDTWILTLAQHLRAEIDTLKPEYFEKVGEENMKEIDGKVTVQMQVYDPAWFLCCAIGESESFRRASPTDQVNSVSRADFAKGDDPAPMVHHLGASSCVFLSCHLRLIADVDC